MHKISYRQFIHEPSLTPLRPSSFRNSTMLATRFENKDIIAATDKCVMCGLCLPHCPTYSVTRNEAESPRGRIALVRALHEEKLSPSPALVNHLDQCLACMNCMSVCPTKVDYAKILDAGRDITGQQHTLRYRIARSLLLVTLSKTGIRKFMKSMLRIYHALRIDRLVKKAAVRFPHLLRVATLIPRPNKIRFTVPSAAGRVPKERVARIESCAGDIFSDAALPAAETVLRALQFETVRFPQTHCCGALHQHNGDPRTARKLIQKFYDTFKGQDIDALISLATGCASQIDRYPELLNSPLSAELASRHKDICSFTVEHFERQALNFRPLPKKVFVHTPCTQRQIGSDAQVVEKLLHAIPGIRLEKLQDNSACCGAGGLNVLFQTEHADRLSQNIITEVVHSGAAYLVTPNIGCALHFRAQLSKMNAAVVVCHPIQLLAGQLIYSGHA
ncbi:MAG: (Fe-S)-binding protein [Proteobacteria bacterium]|nr:(Fe-S)-binding protein [Pseudomonadota bacterium]